MKDLGKSVRFGLARAFAICALGIGLGALVGYVIGQPALLIWSVNGVPMALPTAVAFCFISVSVILAPLR